MTEPMRWLVFGAGAIGAYVGGSLALAGYPVVFIERPTVAAEIAARGMRLEIGGKKQTVRKPTLVASIEAALATGPFDAAVFALKSFDTQSALSTLAPYRQDIPPLLCLQNGVENETLIESMLGQGKVIPGTVTSAIGRQAAGDIVLERLRGVGVAGGHPLSARVAAALSAAGLKAQLFPVAAAMKWSKLLTNLVANASSAILDMTPAEIFAHPGLFALEMAQLREALAVMHALKLRVTDLPGTPVRAMAFAAQRLPLAVARPLLGLAVGRGRGSKMPSFHIDLRSGRGQSEVDYLNGAVVRFGERAGVPTPVNQALTQTLLRLTRREQPLDEYKHKPEALLHLAFNSVTTP